MRQANGEEYRALNSEIGMTRFLIGKGLASIGIGLAAALLLGTFVTGPVWALDDQDRAQDGVRNGQIRPFAQIKDNLERRFGGRVLRVQMSGQGNNSQYDVKLLTKEGDVILIETDARTGRVLGVRGGR
jgi:hypothetical protein